MWLIRCKACVGEKIVSLLDISMDALFQVVFIGFTKSRNEPWPTVCIPIVRKELPYLISCREKSIQAYHLA